MGKTHERIDELETKCRGYKWGIVFKNRKPADLAELIHKLMVLRDETYYLANGKVGRRQCPCLASRSDEDLYRMLLTIDKSIKFSFVDKVMDQLTSFSFHRRFNNWFCSTVRKQVYGPPLNTKESDVREKLGKLNIIFKK